MSSIQRFQRSLTIARCLCVTLITVVAFDFAVERTASAGSRQSCRGVDVAPGDDLQRLIHQHGRRTTFCLARGTYALSGTISTGSKFPTLDLRSGAIIDGQDGNFIGITGSGAPAGRERPS